MDTRSLSCYKVKRILRPFSHSATEIRMLVENGLRKFGFLESLDIGTYSSPANMKDKYTIVVFTLGERIVATSFPNVYNFTEPRYGFVEGTDHIKVMTAIMTGKTIETSTDLLGTPELRFDFACKIIASLLGV